MRTAVNFFVFLEDPYLHSISGVFVVKYKCFLNELMVSLQLINVGFVFNDALLVLTQMG